MIFDQVLPPGGQPLSASVDPKQYALSGVPAPSRVNDR